MNHCGDFTRSLTQVLFSSPSERTADDLEIIYEELLHIKALSHLSTTVSRKFSVLSGRMNPAVTVWTLKLFLSPVGIKHAQLLRPLGPEGWQ